MSHGVPRRILISGAGGLIGSALVPALRANGGSVTTLTRQRSCPGSIHWDPEADELNPDLVSGFDAVIHLAGEPVGNGRWSAEKKRKIYSSRVHGTRLLARSLAGAKEPPRVFLCASGINFYESCGNQVLDETASPGGGFLSQVCLDWERSAATLSEVSRVVTLRIGVVLSREGGTLAKMLPVFRWGLGGYVGKGDHYLSWITLNDLIRAVMHILRSSHVHGPVNIVAPAPVTGRQFAEALGKAVGRPAWLRIPELMMHLVLGEFADETILSSVRAVPTNLIADGFAFQNATIQNALAECLPKKG